MSVKYAYGYIRVSTHDQEEISPDSQEHLLRDYAAKNNIVILKIFTDLGISGRKANKRPGFQEMIGLAKGDDHPVDQILVWKFSRFARNQEESIVYKSLLKKQHNVDVVSVSEPLSDDPFGSLIERIIEWMDEYYSMKRVNGEKYSYFSCYGYSKGKCKKPNGISSLVLEKEVLASIKEILDTKDIVYELREYQPTEQFDERKAITEQLESLTGKDERIKASYREGIDTLEEYKANKAIIQKERESLEQQLKELKKVARKSDQDPADAMLQKVRSVYDILISNNYTYVQKNEALKQIIDKIIYDRKNDSLKIYFFLYR